MVLYHVFMMTGVISKITSIIISKEGWLNSALKICQLAFFYHVYQKYNISSPYIHCFERIWNGTANSRNTRNNEKYHHKTQNNILNTEIHTKYITLWPMPCQIINCFFIINYKNYEGDKEICYLIKI